MYNFTDFYRFAALVNPAVAESLWSMWDWLQSVTAWPLLPTPPSSGFLGLVLLLHHCTSVHVFEYIPSMRLTKRYACRTRGNY